MRLNERKAIGLSATIAIPVAIKIIPVGNGKGNVIVPSVNTTAPTGNTAQRKMMRRNFL